MATILPFVIRRGSISRERYCDVGASIIIFPGVRYERPPADQGRKDTLGAPRKRKGKSR